jgi:carbon-monoxide dehydrogenase large subunit
VGIEAARNGSILVHDDVPGNLAARMVQENGDAAAAIAAAPHRLTLDLQVERSASTPLEPRGVLARWDTESRRLRMWSSTQTATGLRAAIAAKLQLDSSTSKSSRRTSAGGSASRSTTRGPKRCSSLLRHGPSNGR